MSGIKGKIYYWTNQGMSPIGIGDKYVKVDELEKVMAEARREGFEEGKASANQAFPTGIEIVTS